MWWFVKFLAPKDHWSAGPRRVFIAVLFVRLVVAASTATAAEVTLAAPGADRGARPPRAPRLAVMTDVGLPDGVGASLAYRPWRWLRAHVGGGYNLISESVRGGATVVPFGVGPSLTLEAGHFFDGDANGVARAFAGAAYKDSPLLRRIGYDYVNAHLGVELGSRRVTFFLHGGVSYVRARIHDTNAALASELGDKLSPDTAVAVKQDPSVRVFGPSLKLGLLVYLW